MKNPFEYVGIAYDMAFHEKAGRSQAESLSIPFIGKVFSPPS